MKKIFIILLFLSHFVTGQFLPNTKQIVGTKEDIVNKSISKTLGTSDILYPSQKAVKSYVDSLSILAQNGFQAGLNTKLNISQAISFAYPKGFYNVSANSPPLSATPDGSFEQGAFYEINNSGTIGFSGSNFSSGQVLNVGDKLVKIGTQWGYMPYPETSRLKNIEAVVSNYSVLGSAVITNGSYQNSAGTVVTSASRSYTTFTVGNDLIKVSTVVNGGIPVAIFKNSSGTVISTQGTGVNGSDLAFTNYYLNIPAGTVTVVVNGNVASPTIVYKGSVFDQSAQKSVVDALSTNVSSNTSSISSYKPVLSDYITQNVTTTNGYYISSTGVATVSTPRTYATFSATSSDSVQISTQTNGSAINGAVYFNGSGTVIGTQFQGTDNVNINYSNQKLTIPSGTVTVKVNGNLGVPISVKKYGLITKAVPFTVTDALSSRVTTNESSIASYNSILSDYQEQSLTIVSGSYIDYFGAVVTSAARSYTILNVTPGSQIKIGASTINGSAEFLVICKNSAGIVIGRIAQGIDGTNTTYTDYVLTIPDGTTTISVNGLVAFPMVVKKVVLFSKAVSSTATDALNTRITANETSNSAYKLILSDYSPQTVTNTNGYYLDATGTAIASASRKYTCLSATNADLYKVTSTINGNPVPLAVYKRSDNYFLGTQNFGVNGVNTTYTDFSITIPTNTGIVCINGNVSDTLIVKKNVLISQAASKDYVDSKSLTDKTLIGKTVLFLGTSITEGSQYATDAPAKLGGIGINKGVGSSTVRKCRADGTMNGLAWQNYCYSLSQTLAEKDSIINHWSTIRLLLTNNPPSTMDSTTATYIRNCSYERRLIPYLNGTYPMPDYFIFEHGRNDNYSSDTDNQFTTVPTNRTNRHFYIGAMNYLFDLIIKANPYARIAIEGHYENDLLTRVSTAQLVLADYWNIPINKMWEKTGFSQQLVVGSQALWSQAPYSSYTAGQNTSVDMTRQNVYLPDRIHLHSATNGKAQTLMTNLVAEFLKGLN